MDEFTSIALRPAVTLFNFIKVVSADICSIWCSTSVTFGIATFPIGITGSSISSSSESGPVSAAQPAALEIGCAILDDAPASPAHLADVVVVVVQGDLIHAFELIARGGESSLSFAPALDVIRTWI